MTRRRIKQTASLSERLQLMARLARDKAKALAPGSERELLLKQAREADRAVELNDWLAPLATRSADR